MGDRAHNLFSRPMNRESVTPPLRFASQSLHSAAKVVRLSATYCYLNFNAAISILRHKNPKPRRKERKISPSHAHAGPCVTVPSARRQASGDPPASVNNFASQDL